MKIENVHVYCPYCNNWVNESDINYWDCGFDGLIKWGGCPYCNNKLYYSGLHENG